MSNPFEQIQTDLTDIKTLLMSIAATPPHLPHAAEKPVDTKEICSFLNITTPTLIRYRKKGKIPFMRIGAKVMFNKTEVLKALEKNKKG